MNHQIIGQLRLFFGLQNASCCLVVVAFSLFLLVAHTCIIIIIYCKCRGVIFFHSLLFRYVLPHSNYFHILILALFSLFQIFKWIWWRKKKNIFLNRHTMCTDRYECWQKKTPRLNFVVAFRCFTRNMKNFFCRRTLENCFFFLFLFICEGWFLSNYTYFFLSW